MVAEVGTFHVLQEVFVVRDDDELEVGLLLSCPDDVVERLGKRTNVVAVQIRRRLVESDQTTVDAETLRQGEADDDAGKHLLACTAPASHVHFRVLFDHADAVVGGPIAFQTLVVGPDQDAVNVSALVGPTPQLFDDTVDLFHFQAVVFRDGPTK